MHNHHSQSVCSQRTARLFNVRVLIVYNGYNGPLRPFFITVPDLMTSTFAAPRRLGFLVFAFVLVIPSASSKSWYSCARRAGTAIVRT